MDWTAISGSWRKTNEEIEQKVREAVRDALLRGGGIVTGGALGVDYIATDEALRGDPRARCIKIFLPSTLERYAAHMRKRAAEGVVAKKQVETLIAQLKAVKERNADAVIEGAADAPIDTKTYYARNTAIVDAADALVAFRVKTDASEGLGTKDAIDKARAKGIPVTAFEYDLRAH